MGGLSENQESAELLAEICRSSAIYDLETKLALYQTAGVKEYLAVVVPTRQIRWYHLRDGTYQLLSPDADGVWRSLVFPGLWLDGRALLEGRMWQVLALLQQGLASQEHVDFVAQLKAKNPERP